MFQKDKKKKGKQYNIFCTILGLLYNTFLMYLQGGSDY